MEIRFADANLRPDVDCGVMPPCIFLAIAAMLLRPCDCFRPGGGFQRTEQEQVARPQVAKIGKVSEIPKRGRYCLWWRPTPFGEGLARIEHPLCRQLGAGSLGSAGMSGLAGAIYRGSR
jgi:hypothetical protein